MSRRILSFISFFHTVYYIIMDACEKVERMV